MSLLRGGFDGLGDPIQILPTPLRVTSSAMRLTLARGRSSGPFTTRFYNDPSPDGPKPVRGIAPESILVQPAPDAVINAGTPIFIGGWA